MTANIPSASAHSIAGASSRADPVRIHPYRHAATAISPPHITAGLPIIRMPRCTPSTGSYRYQIGRSISGHVYHAA